AGRRSGPAPRRGDRFRRVHGGRQPPDRGRLARHALPAHGRAGADPARDDRRPDQIGPRLPPLDQPGGPARHRRRPAAEVTPAGQRGLDWHNFFVANVQTGFGPFIAVYLTSEAWTERAIGAALSVGTITAIISQLPAGALVDALANKRLAAFAACLAVAASALMFALWPEWL